MLTVIIDADDTLWENNIYYEECLAEFTALMAQEGFDPHEAEETMSAVERERVPEVGYAPEEFARSLVVTYERLCRQHGCPVDDAVAEAVFEIGITVVDYPMVLLEGVEETLERLDGCYRLLLLTKGDQEVQRRKLARSGLGRYFDGVHVVAEKDADVFRDLIAHHDLHPERTWMVGNSPRSDINPAVQAGIGAVYVPHPKTWTLEVEDVVDSERVTVLRAFDELSAFLARSEGGEEGVV
ncbi:MAG: HAD hydrolase-like protein [Chloroflexota bacterium]|nr:HAD hydrolase-like protein [Chloroflexota bacterium]